MITKQVTLDKRGVDDFGSGEFGASRGSRKHKGVDYRAEHGDKIQAPLSGEITKLGYPYADDLSLRYIQLSDENHDFRFFYVNPAGFVELGDWVLEGQVIGTCQHIAGRYNGDGKLMRNHVHLEIREQDSGQFINPEDYWRQNLS